jgi:periplasmic protein TonB
MIGEQFHPVGPETVSSGGWVSAATVSLVGHGILVGALLLMEGDFTPPVAPQAFTVDVVIETAPSGVKATVAKQVPSPAGKPPAAPRRTARLPLKEIATENPAPAPAILKKTLPAAALSKPVPEPLVPESLVSKPLVKAVYAPIPKSKPVLFPLPVAKEPAAEIPSAPPSADENKTGTTAPAYPQQEALLPDAGAALPSLPSDEAAGTAASGVATASLIAPQLVAPQLVTQGGGNPLPPYPRAARRRGLEGRLVLRVTVTAEGKPRIVKVLESSGHALLDDAAVRAVARWQFEPGRRGATPVQASIDLPVVFRLKSDR